MKTIFGLLLCFLFSVNIFGQSEKDETAAVGVEEITLARDDGSGKPGDVTENFVTTDVPIHCSILLNSTKAASVKMNLVAVKAGGLKPETIVITVNYKTNGKQNRVNFNASPDGGAWVSGAYRIDISIDGKINKSQVFEIQKSPKEVENKKQISPKPKMTKPARKN